MSGYNTGLAALSAAQVAIDTIGHNLANATTPGYSRQRVNLASVGSDYGTSRWQQSGVRVASIERITDGLLLRRLQERNQAVGLREAELANFLDVESILGEPGSNGIAARFGEFFNGLSSFATAPDELANRGVVLNAAEDLASRFREISRGLGELAGDAGTQLEDAVASVNVLIEEIGAINQQLSSSVGIVDGGQDLLDRQDALLEELSQYTDARVRRDELGRARVTISGQEVVATHAAIGLELRGIDTGRPEVFAVGGTVPLDVDSGRMSALLAAVEKGGPEARFEELDTIARELITNVNRTYSRGVPRAGGYESLRSAYAIAPADRSGPLAAAGLPYDLAQGRFVLSTVDQATGAVEQQTVTLDPNVNSPDDLVAALDGLAGVSAEFDFDGKLRITADQGKLFHFGPIVDPNPDASGFGTGAARLAGAAEPFALANGDQITVAIDGGAPQTVTFNSAQFSNIGQATAAEVAAAINGTLGFPAARDEGGHLVIESPTSGTSSQLALTATSGSPLAALGFAATSATGTGGSVDVTVSGAYDGDHDDTYTFRPLGSGEVGLTPGLQVEVVNSAGAVVATLDVGDGYSPGEPIALQDGVEVSFGTGILDAAAGDTFDLALYADTDTSDFLVAFGVNALFTGTGAADIAVSRELLDDPERFAQGASAAVSDTRNIDALLALRQAPIEGLDGRSLEGRYGAFVADAGRDTARAEANLDNETRLRDAIGDRLEQVRGVSVDEELVNLQRYQQAYQAAARIIEVVDRINDILFAL
ncbi:MAG: flagellar hook-associated protein FlgK [Planctomycetota bacterium]